MGVLDAIGATTASITGAAKSLADSGPATALAAGGIGGALSSLFGGKAAPKLPLPNVLSSYPTYNYIISIGVLTDNDLNFPDSTYMAGKSFPLICKSANADPYNRVPTPYGKFDFFVDDLQIDSTIGHEKGNNTNATGLSFKVTEPLSMGMFMIALQTAAYQAGHKNYRDAPFILKIEFRGNTSSGTMSLIPNTTRCIPFKFTMLDMKVNQNGAVYNCSGMPYNQPALAARTANLKSDVSIKGKTVQEMLQTGEKSLQAVINQKLRDVAKANNIKEPDEVVIIFPNETASSASQPSAGSKENKSSATTAPSAGGAGGGSIFEKLGISKSKINSTLVQPDGQCNALGKAEMKFDLGTKGDAPVGKDNQVYDADKKVNVRANNTIDPKESDFRFRQDTDIPNAINQVLLNSKFVNDTLDKSKVDKDGMREWWRIDVQVYNVSSDGNLDSTGTKPKLSVFRVVPYAAHSGKLAAVNTQPPGYDNLKRQAVKEYNYIFTGKNTEIINFNIEFNASFMATFAADNFKSTQDAKTSAQTGASNEKDVELTAVDKGNKPAPVAGVTGAMAKHDSTGSKTDKLGGGGNAEDAGTRAARLFHDAITNGKDMMELNMDIIGDPYFIAQSGQGNYTSKPTDKSNLNADGTVNWQNGEVDIIVNFRTPIDLNQQTGLYQFSGGKSAPVVQFSGLYKINTVTSKFSGGKFQQTLVGFRRPQQENPNVSDASKTFSTSNTKEKREGSSE